MSTCPSIYPTVQWRGEVAGAGAGLSAEMVTNPTGSLAPAQHS